MTLDAAKWNDTGGELSSCVINTSIRLCIIIFGTNLPVIHIHVFKIDHTCIDQISIEILKSDKYAES